MAVNRYVAPPATIWRLQLRRLGCVQGPRRTRSRHDSDQQCIDCKLVWLHRTSTRHINGHSASRSRQANRAYHLALAATHASGISCQCGSDQADRRVSYVRLLCLLSWGRVRDDALRFCWRQSRRHSFRHGTDTTRQTDTGTWRECPSRGICRRQISMSISSINAR